jgi:hypothetical protein
VARTVIAFLIAALLGGAALSGFEQTLSLRLIDEAVVLGQSRTEAVHVRFHQPYRLQTPGTPVDYIDVVTPFRRVVLLAEERLRLGMLGFTQREAIAGLGEQSGVIELRVDMTFHPLNVYVGVPAYDVELVTAATPPVRLLPRDLARIPRFGLSTGTAALPSPAGGALNQPGASQPLSGGMIAAGFPIASLNGTGIYDVVVSEKGKELARARVNFSGLR